MKRQAGEQDRTDEHRALALRIPSTRHRVMYVQSAEILYHLMDFNIFLVLHRIKIYTKRMSTVFKPQCFGTEIPPHSQK